MLATSHIPTFSTAGAAWRHALKLIDAQGSKVITEDGQVTKEILNLPLCIQNPLEGWPIADSGWDLPALKVYFETQIIGTENPTGFSYIYGQRIKPHLLRTIQKLDEFPETRRAVISLWEDADYFRQHPPCWMSLEFFIRSNRLHLSAYIRSNDMKQAWPANAYGLSQLMAYVVDQLGGDVEVGHLTTISASAHVYQV